MAFEQQPRESDKAFAAFSLYLSQGPQRSLPAVAAKLGKCESLMEKWSGKFAWPERVRAHGAHLALVEREVAEGIARASGVDWAKRQEEHQEEEWRARGEAIELARAAIARWKANEKRCGTLEGIARLLELASKLGRLASGMATDKTEVTGEVGGVIRVEVEAALDKIYGKPLPGEVIEVESAECRVQSGEGGPFGERALPGERGPTGGGAA